MQTLYMYAAALLPAFLLLLFVWKKDQKKEPFSQLIKAVSYGALICVPIVIVELILNALLFQGGDPTTLFGALCKAFFVAALPEETFKLLALWIVLYKNPYFDEHFDGIVYSVCVGLGFAAVENIGYVVGEEAWTSVAIWRALLAVPGHYAFAVMMGYYYAVYHFVDHSPKTAAKILLIPVLAHGTYDALLMSAIAQPAIILVVFPVVIYFCIKLHKVAYAKLVELIQKDREI